MNWLPWPSRQDLRRLWDYVVEQTKLTTEALLRMENAMATQADIDTLTAKLGELKDHLTSADAGIQAEIDALKAANPAVDVSSLQTAVDALSQQVDATSALVPAPVDEPSVDPAA